MEDIVMNWKLHQEFSSLILKNLFFDKNSSNVTLVAEDNKSVDAHSFVLTYASTFFRDIFVNNPEKHLTLHLQGLKYETLVNLVKYVYLGEAVVRKEDWQDFMANATKWNLVKLIKRNDLRKEDAADISEPSETKPDPVFVGEDLLQESSDFVDQIDDALMEDIKPDVSTDDIDNLGVQEDISVDMEESIAVQEDFPKDVKPELLTGSLDVRKDKHSQEEESTPVQKKFSKIRFECDLCDNEFSNIIDLMQHKRQHTGQTTGRDYSKGIKEEQTPKSRTDSRKGSSSQKSYNHHACDLCDYACSRPIRLKQHKKSRHGISDHGE